MTNLGLFFSICIPWKSVRSESRARHNPWAIIPQVWEKVKIELEHTDSPSDSSRRGRSPNSQKCLIEPLNTKKFLFNFFWPPKQCSGSPEACFCSTLPTRVGYLMLETNGLARIQSVLGAPEAHSSSSGDHQVKYCFTWQCLLCWGLTLVPPMPELSSWPLSHFLSTRCQGNGKKFFS